MKVTEKDLTGELEGFPIEVVEGMLQRQYEQTGRRDVSVFQEDRAAGGEYRGGFTWIRTPEGGDFWDKVIDGREFSRFKTGYRGPGPLRERPKLEIPKSMVTEEELRRILFGSWEVREAKEKTGMTEEQVKSIAAKVYSDCEKLKIPLEDRLKQLGFYPQPITVEIKTPQEGNQKGGKPAFPVPAGIESIGGPRKRGSDRTRRIG